MYETGRKRARALWVRTLDGENEWKNGKKRRRKEYTINISRKSNTTNAQNVWKNSTGKKIESKLHASSA